MKNNKYINNVKGSVNYNKINYKYALKLKDYIQFVSKDLEPQHYPKLSKLK